MLMIGQLRAKDAFSSNDIGAGGELQTDGPNGYCALASRENCQSGSYFQATTGLFFSSHF